MESLNELKKINMMANTT